MDDRDRNKTSNSNSLEIELSSASFLLLNPDKKRSQSFIRISSWKMKIEVPEPTSTSTGDNKQEGNISDKEDPQKGAEEEEEANQFQEEEDESNDGDGDSNSHNSDNNEEALSIVNRKNNLMSEPYVWSNEVSEEEEAEGAALNYDDDEEEEGYVWDTVNKSREEARDEDVKEVQDNDAHNENNHLEPCPICLMNENDVDEDIKFVYGPCQHKYCVPCIEHVLNVKAELRQPKGGSDMHLSAPTLGRCPICRIELSLFDLEYDNDINGNSSEDDDEEEQDQSPTLHCPPCIDYYDTELHGKDCCPLVDEIYIPYRGGKIGQLSFHWDWSKLKRGAQQRPFLNASSTIPRNPNQWKFDTNGKSVPHIIFFDEGCHFHAESRTFHGQIDWLARYGSRLNGSHTWNIVLGFPSDYRFLSSGRIHMLKDYTPVAPSTVTSNYTTDQQRLCHYPLDGRWTVSWKTLQGEIRRSEIHIRNNEYVQSGYTFYLILDKDPKHTIIYWPKSKHSQTCTSGIDLYKQPLGPSPGAKITWTTTSPNFPGNIIWERQTMGPIPIPKVISFGMGAGKQLYQKYNCKTSDAIPKYCLESLWGNIFCKRLHVGSASYHFLSPTNSYISYQHPACRDLPPLDDGTPMPTRVDFHNLEFNEEERKLTANIEWEQDFGTSWNDNVRWTLTMHFDTEYMMILKGGIQCEWCHERRARSRPPRRQNQHRPAPVAVYVPPPQPTPEDEQEIPPPEPDRNEEWVMSGYGHDQLYINAACLERYRNDTVVVDYKEIAKQQCQRLEGEGATKRSLGFLNHVFSLAADRPNDNVIDFLL